MVCHFLLQGIFPTQGLDPGVEPRSPALQADTLSSEPPTCYIRVCIYIYIHTYIIYLHYIIANSNFFHFIMNNQHKSFITLRIVKCYKNILLSKYIKPRIVVSNNTIHTIHYNVLPNKKIITDLFFLN